VQRDTRETEGHPDGASEGLAHQAVVVVEEVSQAAYLHPALDGLGIVE
jgi:hypothetical protein